MAAWYEKSFGSDYLLVYKHRDIEGAKDEVRRMIGWLALPPGSRVLDLCCGMGRHSLALDEYGYRVTGVDLSEALLAEARRMDAEGRVRWVRGDMREVPLDETFDAIVNLFTSFGYFDTDEENGRVLGEMRRLLAPGGSFIIDFLNPSHVRSHLVSYSEKREGDVVIEERRAIEGDKVVKRIALREGDTPAREYIEQVKLYERADFERLLEGHGLALRHVYGGYDQRDYEAADSPRMIMVGVRP